MAYAEGTKVSVAKTKADIEALITKRGATDYATFAGAGHAKIAFVLDGIRYLFELRLPDRDDRVFTHSSRGARSDDTAGRLWEQACRAQWRALLLSIKAKFAAVDAGIETQIEAFMPHVMTPDGHRFSGEAQRALAEAYKAGGAPRLLLGAPAS